MLNQLLPRLPLSHSAPYVVASELVAAVLIGPAAGVLTAYRASRMDPVEGLRAE
jgi:ABC-type lipoprotein release transport system permease subunit